MDAIDPEVLRDLASARRRYVSTVSMPGMAISLELATYLWTLLQQQQPERIADLGSGFSSFVFRRYAKTCGRAVTVWTVDDDPDWLQQTRDFLITHKLSAEHLCTWDVFDECDFDLVLHDLGDMETRRSTLARALSLVRRGGVVVLDDLHYPVYTEHVRQALERRGLRARALCQETMDPWGRYSWLVIPDPAAAVRPRTPEPAGRAVAGAGTRAPAQVAASHQERHDRERIFVQIVSYRDPELPWTVRDLFEKASHPARISLGVCLQIDPEADCDCDLPELRPEQTRCLRYRARDSRGVCWARHETQKLWAGEEFTLQIDSHTRFEWGWDEKLLETLHACPSEKAVLSTYPPAYYPPDIVSAGYYTLMHPRFFDGRSTLHLGTKLLPLREAPARPVLGAFCAGSFLFGPASILREVPYDPYLYFLGEEITLSVRLWTHGWDIYHPNTTVLYHRWDRDYRPKHWEEVAKAAVLDRRSRRRVNHLLGIEASTDAEALVELDRYGLGTVRTLAQYQEFSGVDFGKRVCRRSAALTPEARRPIW